MKRRSERGAGQVTREWSRKRMMKIAKKRTRMRIRKGKRIIKGKKIWKRIRKSILKPKLAPNHPQTPPKPPTNCPKTTFKPATNHP